MKVLLTTEARLLQTSDGRFETVDPTAGETQWRRYARSEWTLSLIARTSSVEDRSGVRVPDTIRSARVVPLPASRGLGGFLRTIFPTVRIVSKQVRDSDLSILRVPGLVATLTAVFAIVHRKPYVVDLVGDIRSVMESSPSRRVRRIAPLATGLTRLIVRRAKSARYITFKALQELYPTDAPSYAISNVQIPASEYVDEPRTERPNVGPIRLLCVGSQDFPYKGHNDAITAVRELSDMGVEAHLSIIGDGVYHESYVTLSEDLGVRDRVSFLGRLAHDETVRTMRMADLLVHPSLSEGQGRVIIEAMAQGCPVVATSVGGIPELVREDARVPVRSPNAIAKKVVSLVERDTYGAHAASSLASAQRFRMDLLDVQFDAWCAHLFELGR